MKYSTAMIQLPLVRESTGQKIIQPAEVFELCKDLQGLAQECFQVLTLNSQNELIDRHMITLGLVNASLVHPREVFRAAVTDSAAAIILVHNHPSGGTSPSAEDIRITKRLIKAGAVMGIAIADHIIIGKDHLSMMESGVADFSDRSWQ